MIDENIFKNLKIDYTGTGYLFDFEIIPHGNNTYLIKEPGNRDWVLIKFFGPLLKYEGNQYLYDKLNKRLMLDKLNRELPPKEKTRKVKI